MKKTISIFVALGSILIIFWVLGSLSGISFLFHPFHEKCLDLSQGMSTEEVRERMQDFINNPDYTVTESGASGYGWKNMLTYDNSLLLVLEKEPWYKLDQHPWMCKILFTEGLVVEIEPFFD